MILIKTNNRCKKEKQYILNYVLTSLFDLDFNLVFNDAVFSDILEFECNGKTLVLSAEIFRNLDIAWLEKSSLHYNAGKESILISNREYAFYRLKAMVENRNGSFSSNGLTFDFFGAIFYLISGYEESVIKERDAFDRFSLASSKIFDEVSVLVPIANEYIEIVRVLFESCFGLTVRKNKTFKIIPSHDVDSPFFPSLRTPYYAGRQIAKSLIKEKNLGKFFGVSKAVLQSTVSLKNDPFYKFDDIIEASVAQKLKSCFYFITKRTATKSIDGYYSFKSKRIKQLISKILSKGQDIGLHPSFFTYKSPENIKREVEIFLDVAASVSSQPIELKSRQHILRWDNSLTPRALSDIGVKEDSTLSFAEHPGFRRGICFKYPIYDLQNRNRLEILESPLVLMECSLLDDRYLGYGTSNDSYDMIAKLKKECLKYNGNFTVLWHNHRFVDKAEVELYKYAIAGEI